MLIKIVRKQNVKYLIVNEDMLVNVIFGESTEDAALVTTVLTNTMFIILQIQVLK